MSLNVVEALALQKAVAEATKDMTLAPGSYQVDASFNVSIVGTMKKGNDVDYTPTVTIPLKQALALALHYAGCTRQNAQNIIIQAMTAALNGEDVSIADALPDVDAAMKHVQEITEALPKKTRSGALTSKLVLLVGDEQETIQNPNRLTDPRSKKASAELVTV